MGRCGRVEALMLLASVPALVMDGAAAQQPQQPGCGSQVEYERWLAQVATNCCDQFGQEDNCANGMPSECDTRCAAVYGIFYTACQDYLTTSLNSPGVRQQLVATHGKCHATEQANLVHDTDLITPGEQHDMSAKLAVPVNCHNMQLTTAEELNDNTGPMDSLWMIGVKGETSCMYKQGPNTMGGYTTKEEHDNCPALVNKQRVQDLLVARYGECVEHRPSPPPPGETGHSLVQVHVDVVASGGVKGHTTYQLSLKCAIQTDADGTDHCGIDNLYAMYGSPAVSAGPNAGEPAHGMEFPAAYQEPAPFGATVGGTNPAFWAISPSAQYDSWLAVAETTGATQSVSSIGIDFDSWTDELSLVIDNGAVFWMDPNAAPSVDPANPSAWQCVLAQVTVEDGATWSATINVRGKLAGYEDNGGNDWEATRLVFSDADVPVWEGGDGEGSIEDGHRRQHRRRRAQKPVGPPEELAPGSGGMANMICDFSMDTNEDGEVGEGDDEWESMAMFSAIFSKDALFYLATDSEIAPLIDYAECDEVVGGR